jgi:uncharacterized protein YkwD
MVRSPRTLSLLAGSILAVASLSPLSASSRLGGTSHDTIHQSQSATELLLSTINAMREGKHLKPFAWNATLAGCAHKHSVAMANDGTTGSLFHDLKDDACIKYQAAGENIGYSTGTPAQAVLAIQKQMMAEGPCPSSCPDGSPAWEAHGHYLNLTSKVYTRVGVGVYTEYYSSIHASLTWITEDFVKP